MKIKIFTNYDQDTLCYDINTFIHNKEVVDIKYSNIADEHGRCFYTALVMVK